MVDFDRISSRLTLTVLALAMGSVSVAGELFDMDAIRDPKTLEIEVLQEWHVAEGPIITRQKLVTINVGELWPGQDYRVPVRMVVPAEGKAKGFHITGGSTPTRLKQDAKPNALERELLRGGVGLVYTGAAYRVVPKNPPNEGILFVNHAPANRSGHLGHALVEYEDGKLIAFYPNCSADNKGHSAVGWMEYKRSEDGGETWGQPQVLAYSRKLFEAGQQAKPGTKRLSAFAEKAVLTDKGEIVLFFLVCDITKDTVWRRFQRPTCIISSDGGHTWSEPSQLCDIRGRIYDARYDNGEILALFFANDNENSFLGNKPEHVYELFLSGDGGRSFSKRSVLPFDTMARSQGTMGRLARGELIAYVYNRDDEYALDYVVSDDAGRTWSDVKTSRFAKRIRNPQMSELNGAYFMFGRSGSLGKKKEQGHNQLNPSALER